MEYGIYPHRYFRITQSHLGTISHCDKNDSSKHVKAIDMGGQYGAGSNAEKYYAPFTCKVLKNDSASSGTVYFGSCDINGNQKAIILADGTTSVVTMAMTHSNDTDWLTEGKIFNAGDHIYNEGTAGGVSEHVHVEFARGWVTTKETVSLYVDFNADGVFANQNIKRFSNSISLYPHEVLRKHTGYTYSSNDQSIYTTQSPYNTWFKSTATLGQTNIAGVRLLAKGNVLMRAYPGSTVTVQTLANGTSFEICRFLGVSSKDNYQWVMVKNSANIYGYIQLDPKNYSIIDPNNFNPNKTLYLYQDNNATYNGFLIRLNSPVNGAPWVTCPKGKKAQVLAVTDVQSDGYQWVKVRFTHTDGSTKEGYVQFDTYKHCRIGL